MPKSKGTLPRIRTCFGPRLLRPDPPGAVRRSHFFQVPSDRARELTAEYLTKLIGLFPDVDWHNQAIRTMRTMIGNGEDALKHHLEARDDFKGHILNVGPIPDDPDEPEAIKPKRPYGPRKKS